MRQAPIPAGVTMHVTVITASGSATAVNDRAHCSQSRQQVRAEGSTATEDASAYDNYDTSTMVTLANQTGEMGLAVPAAAAISSPPLVGAEVSTSVTATCTSNPLLSASTDPAATYSL